VDLAVWFRARRWVALLELIGQLPQSSRLNEVQLDDPEFAAEIAAAERRAEQSGSTREWRPKIRDWDLHAQLLREIREAVIAVRSGLYETTYLPVGDGKLRALRAPRTEVLPGPETEADRVKARLSRQSQLEIIALFAPHALQGLQVQ